jgi:hypothetical protein
MLVDRDGFCQVSFLPERKADLPQTMAANGSAGPVVLTALQDDWFQDVFLDDLGARLRDGVQWEASCDSGGTVRWVLRGREIYVLSAHDELNGWVSRTRLALGVEHIVLCSIERLEQVSQVIREAGSETPEILDESMGAPKGWVALKKVIPIHPIPAVDDSDILNILRPNGETVIEFELGIRMQYATWLAGYPPKIQVRGDISRIRSLLIDGQDATLAADGGWVAPGWDSLGIHTVWCDGAAKTYKIEEGAEVWQPWDAFSFGNPTRTDSRISCCGAVIQRTFEDTPRRETILVPATNPVLIGPTPGQIFRARPRSDAYRAPCIADPQFRPTWALPAIPLQCRRATTEILLIGKPVPPNPPPERLLRSDRRLVIAWCSIIMEASQKHLRTAPDAGTADSLWHEYAQRARDLRRLLH